MGRWEPEGLGKPLLINTHQNVLPAQLPFTDGETGPERERISTVTRLVSPGLLILFFE